MDPSILFVYGTLRKGCDNEHARLLAANSEFLGKASIAGCLHGFDWHPGAYPPSEPGDRIHGDAFRMHDPAALLATLDAYEGEDFHRIVTDTLIDSGETVRAWVYLYHGPKVGLRIASGDWFKDS